MGLDPQPVYREALSGLIELLRLAGENGWRAELEKHLDEWDRERSVRSHLYVYGGMGSFNDIFLTSANGHRVRREQEGWVNECFDALKHECFAAASRIAADRGDGSDPYRTEPSSASSLQGWVCHECGQRYIDLHWLQFAAAERWTRRTVPESIATGQGAEVARRAYRFDEDLECLAYQQELENVVRGLGFPAVPDEFDFQHDPCARCGARNWAVFHWDVVERPLTLRESESNLPAPPQPRA